MVADISREDGAVGVIVLGTGRSGTSAISRAFVLSGYFAGLEEELLGPASSNEFGHYEPLSVLEANEELLADFGSRWWADLPDRDEQVRRRDELLPKMKSLLEAILAKGDGAPVSIKEPRINTLLPLWQPLIEGALYPVLAIRDPLAIAMSLETRDEIPLANALAAWEAQTAMALDWAHGRSITIAPYAELLSNTKLATEIVGSATSHLKPEFAVRIDTSEAPGAIQPKLRHEIADDLNHDEHLTGHQAELWKYLEALPTGEVILDVPAQLRRPTAAALAAIRNEGDRLEVLAERHRLDAKLWEESSRTSELAAELEQAKAKLGQLRQQLVDAETLIAAFEASTSWRITAPLRFAKRHRPGA